MKRKQKLLDHMSPERNQNEYEFVLTRVLTILLEKR